jgi:hypothetical protein
MTRCSVCRYSCDSTAVISALFAFAVAASAQSAFVDRKQVSAATARKLVDACTARAEQLKQIVGCAVVDIAGVLVDFHTMAAKPKRRC